MSTHRHNSDPAKGLVCSHAITIEMHDALGTPASKMEDSFFIKDNGTRCPTIVGSRAMTNEAVSMGFARHCTMDPSEVHAARAVRTAATAAERARAVEALPFWNAILRAEDRVG